MGGEKPGLIQHRLETVREASFIGREAEQDLFLDLLETAASWRVLWVCGPGGVGKTTLLDVFERQANERDIPVARLDGRSLPANPNSLEQALQPYTVAGDASRLRVLMVDTFEHLMMLEGWLRKQWLPRVPDYYRIVLSGRSQPAAEWITDPGWGPLTRNIELPYFTAEESEEYLRRREVPLSARPQAAAFVRGSPLLLALAADLLLRRPGARLEVKDREGLLHQLVQSVLRDVDDPNQRLAMEAASIVYHLNAPLLADMLARNEVDDLYAWLQSLSYTESSERGLILHDLMREAVAQELRHTDPIRYDRLVRTAHAHIAARAMREVPAEREISTLELFYTQRDIEPVAALFQADPEQACYSEPAQETDWPAIRDMVLKHEGEGSLRVLEHWRARQPAGLMAIRDRGQRLRGFIYHCDPGLAQEQDLRTDPVVRVAANCLSAQPPGKGKKTMLIRFWMAAESYQDPSPAATYVHAFATSQCLVMSDPAFVMMLQSDDALHNQMAQMVGNQRLPLPGNPSIGPPQAIFFHDFTRQTPAEWMEELIATSRGALSEAANKFGKDQFNAEVKQALRDYGRIDRLAESPLLDCVALQAGPSLDPLQRADLLRQWIAETARQFGDNPKTECLYKILERTYLKPAANQAAAAEALNLSERTYRRRLTEAINLLAAELWAAEKIAS